MLHTPPLELRLHDPEPARGYVEASAELIPPGEPSSRLWYRVPEAYFNPQRAADALMIGSLFFAMKRGAPVETTARICPQLLANLDEFQAAWSSWFPKSYRCVAIRAEAREQQPVADDGSAVAAFSGGVDSCFSVWRHRRGPSDWGTRHLRAGLLVHGFDIRLGDEATFSASARSARAILDSIDVDLITLTTNAREIGGNWSHTHGAAIASALHLASGTARCGLVASSPTYDRLETSLRCGSNPLTDRMLSSAAFEIRNDAASFTRTDKCRALAAWPEALEHVRVCWQNRHGARNCGRCEKCVRSIVAFRAVGIPLPKSFEHDISTGDILRLRSLSPAHVSIYRELLGVARGNGIQDPWVSALDWRLRATAWTGGLRRHLPIGRALVQH